MGAARAKDVCTGFSIATPPFLHKRPPGVMPNPPEGSDRDLTFRFFLKIHLRT
jgi:hypothetical protein